MFQSRALHRNYEFEKRIVARVRALSGPAPRGFRKYTPLFVVRFILASALFVTLLFGLPNRFFDPAVLHITLGLGVLGIWRFGWWFTHALRAEYHSRFIWPGVRKRADAVWEGGWRPRRLHIQMTTYREEPAITRQVLISILDQVRRERIPTTLWIGTGDASDEAVVHQTVETFGADIPGDIAEVVCLRQNTPGKRMAIGLVLRGMSRHGVSPDDLIIFMDGDVVYARNVLARTLPLFGADPDLQACTTDEEVVCFGPRWIGSWLEMRFAQRRLAMRSHAVSDRVLTLTGRFSVFRAGHVTDPRFIRTIEADHLDHWFWGRFRFLSGDDKSTWYHLLRNRAKMTYVPDATVFTIEVIQGSGLKRMIENFRRWSGNMLRNGSRAIALGPRVVPPFIWWCIVDQRIAMWTMMVGPILSIFALLIEPLYLVNVLVWVLASRFMLSLWLYRHARRPDLSWPYILYFNQLINASVKIFMSFNLARQRWSNRGGQDTDDAAGRWLVFKARLALGQMIITVAAFVTLLAIYAGYLR